MVLILAGCRRDESPAYLQSLLDRTPIPTARIRELLEIEPGELEIVGGPAPEVLEYPSAPLWHLRNRGDRPLWIHRDELVLRARVTPLFSLSGGCGGPMRVWAPERPNFKAADWVLLRPSMTVPLQVPEPSTWGRVDWTLAVGGSGRGVFLKAEGFNLNKPVPAPSGWDLALQLTPGTSWHFPPFHWTGQGDPAVLGPANVRLTREDDGRFLFRADTPRDSERPEAPRMTGVVLRESRELAYHGPLEAVSHAERRGEHDRKVTSAYRLPVTLPPGDYRLLAVAKNGIGYLYDRNYPKEETRDAYSPWIPFSARPSASPGSPGGGEPRD